MIYLPKVYFSYRKLSLLGLILLLIFNFECIAQNQDKIWYFGGANPAGVPNNTSGGVNFLTVPPIPLTDGNIAAQEGVSVIADYEGNLLFYSNGENIWNASHDTMLNGSMLSGSQSSVDGVVIDQKPGSEYLYYVFYVSYQLNGGLYYSVIDMRLDNGLGGIVSTKKNIQLVDTTSEAICGIRHANGCDLWVIVKRFRSEGLTAFLLNSQGISDTVFSSFFGSFFTDPYRTIGHSIASSASGAKVVVTKPTVSGIGGSFALFDFDNSNGTFSNIQSIIVPNDYYLVHAAFSPNEQYLYTSHSYIGYKLNQFDISNPANILSSKTTLHTTSNQIEMGALKLAPDGKIYHALTKAASSPPPDGIDGGYGYLGVINFPDSGLGNVVNYVQDGFFLDGKKSKSGLPNMINQYPSKPTEITYFISDSILNLGDTLYLSHTSNQGFRTWISDTGIVDTVRSIAYAPLDTGEHIIRLVVPNNCILDTLAFKVEVIGPTVDLPNSLFIPNAFSPELGESNQGFRVLGQNIMNVEMSIFDIYGNEVYLSHGANPTWDGKVYNELAPLSVYTYKVFCEFEDGSLAIRYGNVLLIN